MWQAIPHIAAFLSSSTVKRTDFPTWSKMSGSTIWLDGHITELGGIEQYNLVVLAN